MVSVVTTCDERFLLTLDCHCASKPKIIYLICSIKSVRTIDNELTDFSVLGKQIFWSDRRATFCRFSRLGMEAKSTALLCL